MLVPDLPDIQGCALFARSDAVQDALFSRMVCTRVMDYV